jgi:hypothetical protein
MFDGGAFLRKWGSGGSLSVRRMVIARPLSSTTPESFSEVIGRGVRTILWTERQRDQIRCGVEADGVHKFLNKVDDDVCGFKAQRTNEIRYTGGSSSYTHEPACSV